MMNMNKELWQVPDGHVWAMDERPEDNDTVQDVTAGGGALHAGPDREVVERGAFYFALGGWNRAMSSCIATESWQVLVQRGWSPKSARFAIEQVALCDQALRDQAGFGDLDSATGRLKPVVDALQLLQS